MRRRQATFFVLATGLVVGLLVPASRNSAIGFFLRTLTSSAAFQRVEPFRIFDNVSYVGLRSVSAYLIETSEGLILIDAGYGDFIDVVVSGIERLGLDPLDLRYVLVTHGHRDHVGGAAELQARFGARVGMSIQDWELAEQRAPIDGFPAPARDLILRDGEELTLGNTTIRFHWTPGHTRGVMSMEFDAVDGEEVYRAFVLGGITVPYGDAEGTAAYLESVRRVTRVAGEAPPISVNLPNHPAAGQVFARKEALASRGPGEPHPFVDPTGFVVWLERLERDANGNIPVP